MSANKRKTPGFTIADLFTRESLPLLLLIVLGLFAIVAITVSIVVLKVGPVIACAMVILEAALAACLNRIPLWIHGLVFIAEIVIGIMASQLVFMVLMAFVYVISIAFLFAWSTNN